MLTAQQIEERIKEPRVGGNLARGISIQNEHKIHITGEGYETKLNQLVGFESKGDYNIRRQLSKPSTIQLMTLILDNLNRWLSTQGTVKKVDFKQQEQGKKFSEVLDQVWRGGSMEDFIRDFYKDAIYQESNGFLVVTKPKIQEGRTLLREDVEIPYDGVSALMPYIIFVAAEDVHDFNAMGDQLEYLIFKVGDYKDVKYYRVLDDTQDTMVQVEGDKIFIRDTDITTHGLDYTPAIQISSILANLRNDKVRTSPIGHVIPALDRYLQKDSDLIIQMVRHMYPKLASVTTACKTCDGDGHYYDDKTKVTCKDCGGTGKVIPISRDGIIGMPQYIDEGKTPYPGSPASYITPDNASLQTAIDDLKDLAQDILYSATGDKNIIAESLNTATENLINFKGLEDRISDIVTMVETREKFLVETIALMHNDFKNGFQGVNIRYGRRLVLRGESDILNEITASKEAAMPTSHIESLQMELIYSRYKNNPEELERQKLLADVEPLSGYTPDEIITLREFIPEDEIRIKFNFNRLVDLFEEQFGQIHLYSAEMDWDRRVQVIYTEIKRLSDEIFSVSGGGDDDRGRSVADTQGD